MTDERSSFPISISVNAPSFPGFAVQVDGRWKLRAYSRLAETLRINRGDRPGSAGPAIKSRETWPARCRSRPDWSSDHVSRLEPPAQQDMDRHASGCHDDNRGSFPGVFTGAPGQAVRGSTPRATIAQARRLIDAQDYSAATVLLEDLLPDANASRQAGDPRASPAVLRSDGPRGQGRGTRPRGGALTWITWPSLPGCRGRPRQPTDRRNAAETGPPRSRRRRERSLDAPRIERSRPRAARNVSLSARLKKRLQRCPPPPSPRRSPNRRRRRMPETLPLLPSDIASPSSRDSSPAAPRACAASRPQRLRLATRQDRRARRRAPRKPSARQESVTGSARPMVRSGPTTPKPATAGPTLEEGDRLFAAGKYLTTPADATRHSPARTVCPPIGRNTGRTAEWSRLRARSIFGRDRRASGTRSRPKSSVSSG